MLLNKKIIVVLPAYNAARTLEKTLSAIPRDIVDEVILVDDGSKDKTVETSQALGIKTFVHKRNRGYGANQKTCYKEALKADADIVVMVHPDFQYDPRFIPQMVTPIREGRADAVFGSRMMRPREALAGGMPRWKWLANLALTKLENFILGLNLTEYHSGFRAYSRKVLELPIELNSDNFVFDTEIIVQIKLAGMRIQEIPITTRYFPEASMIGFWRSVRYGLSILIVMLKYIRGVISIEVSDIICSLCNTSKSVLFRHETTSLDELFASPYKVTEEKVGEHSEIRQCMNCKVIFVPQTEDLQNKLNNYYSDAPLDETYMLDFEGRSRTAREVLAKFSGRKLLDFGCNTGILLSEAKKLGFDVTGIEASMSARKYARDKFGLEIKDRLVLNETFNTITLLDVLEHVTDPMGLMKMLSGCLEKGGELAIAVPDVTSFGARIMGSHWPGLVPGHLFFFTTESIEYVAGVCDLRIDKKFWYKRYFSIGSILRRFLKKVDLKVPLIGVSIIPINSFDEPLWILKKE